MRLSELSAYRGQYPGERVQIFIDESNLYHSLISECHRSNLDYLKFAEKLTNGRKLIRVNLYMATVDPTRSPDDAREKQQSIDTLQRLPYISIIQKMLNYTQDGSPYEKGIDILVAVDMLTHALRGHGNILKRLLIHVGGFNLSLVMRAVFGIGKPRGLQGLAFDIFQALSDLLCSPWWPCQCHDRFENTSASLI